jgi:hypothetical protein
LKNKAPAKSPLRKLMSTGMVVFYIKATTGDAGVWVQPSYLNMSSFKGSVIALEVDDDPIREAYSDGFDEVLLRLSFEERSLFGAVPWERALLSAVPLLAVPWSVSFFCLSTSERPTADEFVPGHVVVEPCRFWDPAKHKGSGGKGRKPNKKKQRRDSADDVGNAPLVDEAASDGEAGPGSADEPENDCHESSAGSSEEERPEDAEWVELGEVQLAAAQLGHVAPDDADEADDDATVDDDDDEDDFDLEEAGMKPDGPNTEPDSDGGGSCDPSAGPSCGPPPPAAAASSSAAAASVPYPAHVPRAARRPDFPQAVHPSMNGYVRLSQTKNVAHKDRILQPR